MTLGRPVWIALTALALATSSVANAQPAGDTTENAGGGFARLAAEAADHFRAGRYEQALRGYEQAIRSGPPPEDRATLELNAASCLFELGRYDESEQRFVAAASLDAGLAPIALLDAGMAAARAGRLDAAERHLRTAPTGDAEAEARRRELAELVRQMKAERRTPEPRAAPAEAASGPSREPELLPARGWAGWIGAGAGYDTNPLQSGLAETAAASGQGSGGAGKGRRRSSTTSGSAFLTAGAELEHTFGFGRQWALQPYYALDWLGLLDRTAQELSVLSHDLGPRLYWAPARALRLRASASAGYDLVGLDPMEPLAWRLRGEIRADWHVRSSRTRLQGAVTRTTGLSDYEFLTGTLTELALSERLELGPVGLEVRGQLRNNDIGVQRLALSAESYPSCPTCAGQTYVIPLGYFEYGARGAVEVDVTERLLFGASASVAFRTYADESSITAVPASAKQREDRRIGAGAQAELALDEAGSFLLVLRYDLLWSDSNVALDPADPAHALDYDDRNYVQHVVEGGFELYF